MNQSIQTPRLVVGLGNPGVRYQRTRHNIGFRVLDALADQLRVELSRHARNIVYGCGELDGTKLVLAKPMAFMNLSGPPVKLLAQRLQLREEQILVIHDDIDLAFGRIKLKMKGGMGGHNGLRSLVGALGNGDFTRLRMGVGRPVDGREVVDHVLGVFTSPEREGLTEFIDLGCKAVFTVLSQGAQAGMNRFNNMCIMTPCHTTDGGKNGFYIG